MDAHARFSAAATAGAERLGVLALLRARPAGAGELAAELGLVPRRLGALLDVLVATGVLTRDGEALRAAAAGFDPDTPGAALVAEVLRRDRPLDRDDRWSLQIEASAVALAGLFTRGAPKQEVADRLAPELAGGGVVLDAGGGLGDMTRALLERAPRATAVLVDQPAIAAAARRPLADLGARVHFLAGDLTQVVLPPARVAILADVLHLHGPDTAAHIVARVAATVEPGGMLAVKDLHLDDARRGPPTALLFRLGLALLSPEGDVHTHGRLVGWLHDAGGQGVTAVTLASAPAWSLFTARM